MRKDKKCSKNVVRRTQNFCLCFASTVSDDEQTVEDPYSSEAETRQIASPYRDSTANAEVPGSSTFVNFQSLSVARNFRLGVVSTAATTQQVEPSKSQDYRHNADDGDDGSYVVHTSVDYTNCLVPGLDKIMAAPYYWGVMDRYEAEDLLENKPEGTFLLRDSAQKEYLFSVSFRRYKRTLHARIEQKNHYFSFDFSDTTLYSASTITNLIAYYSDATKCLFFEPQLTIPLPRNFVFSLQNLCRARIASLTTYDGVEKLNLPQVLKNYVKEYFYKHPVKTINHASPFEASQNEGPNSRQKLSGHWKKISRRVLDS